MAGEWRLWRHTARTEPTFPKHFLWTHIPVPMWGARVLVLEPMSVPHPFARVVGQTVSGYGTRKWAAATHVIRCGTQSLRSLYFSWLCATDRGGTRGWGWFLGKLTPGVVGSYAVWCERLFGCHICHLVDARLEAVGLAELGSPSP